MHSRRNDGKTLKKFLIRQKKVNTSHVIRHMSHVLASERMTFQFETKICPSKGRCKLPNYLYFWSIVLTTWQLRRPEEGRIQNVKSSPVYTWALNALVYL